MKKLILFLYLLLYCFGNAQQTNLAETQKLAEQGNATAQYNLGTTYANGKGAKQSYSKAVYWYTKAAEQGNANAQNNLGVAYHNGNGVEQDKNKAIYWFRKACENFNDDACENLNRIK